MCRVAEEREWVAHVLLPECDDVYQNETLINLLNLNLLVLSRGGSNTEDCCI